MITDANHDRLTAERAARRAAFRDGVRDMWPAIPGVLAWGLVTGVAMVQAGLALRFVLGLSLSAYAGSAQLATVPLMVVGVPLSIVLATALLVNLRFVIYSAALRPYFASLPRWRRLLLGYLTGDFAFVIFMRRMESDADWPPRAAYFLGLVLTNFAAWHVASLLGIFGSSWIPAQWGLGFAGTLALLALLIPACMKWPAALGALTAGVVAIASIHWPFRLGLLAAIGCGVAAAMIADSPPRAPGRKS